MCSLHLPDWVHSVPVPALSSFGSCLLQFLTLDNTLTQYTLGKNSSGVGWGGGSHSKKHFESVNVMGREKAITGVQSNLTKV